MKPGAAATLEPNSQAVRHLAAGGLLLTPGLRQARIYRRLHDRSQLAAGRRAWPTARVLPLPTWLLECWGERALADVDWPEPLRPAALSWIWRREAARHAPDLLDAASLGAEARESWLALHSWGGSLAEAARFPLTRDQQVFLGIAKGVEAELAARNACDPDDLARLAAARSAIPAEGPGILLAGFRRPTPAVSQLFEGLRKRGRSVARLEPCDDAAAATHAAPDPELEREALVSWLRGRLDRNPDGLHAAIVPDLDRQRGALRRALEAALQPALELPGARPRERVFDLAGGPPLGAQAVVAAALDAVACARGELDWALASRLLRSRHLSADGGEEEARTRLDVSLRESAAVSAPTTDWLAAQAERTAPLFASRMRAARSIFAGRERRDAGRWAEAVGACLEAWGWPGGIGTLASADFQAARRFRELLDDLAGLAAVAPALDGEEAQSELARLVSAPFQPESGEPSVYVLDAWDDPGVQFDSLWVAGLTAAAWPRPVAVDPLLPIEVQRALGLPRVTAAACVAEAAEITDRWRRSSGELVLSWPTRENDTEVDRSPLVPALPSLREPEPAPLRERLVFAGRALETFEDDPPPNAQGPTAGGARVLELQARCPFRAFAELRLGARPLEEPHAGVDRRLRGIALHRALELLWTGLRTQDALAGLAAPARAARIEQAVDRALAQALPAGCGPRSTALEREWQLRAVAATVDADLARAPFEVIETERRLAGRIGALELALRVDRVDRVAGDIVLIDYKSGRVREQPWRGARMEAPQLPLYAVLHPARPSAVAIAEVGADGVRYRGVSREAGMIDTLVAAPEFELNEERDTGFDWERIRAHWHGWLERLALDFGESRSDVDPKLGARTCRTCHLAALCRVTPAPPDEADVAEAADDG